MKLNHVHLTVTDVAAAKNFLVTYFGMQSLPGGKTNFDAVFDDDGLVLTLMKAGRGKKVEHAEHVHIGFIQPNEEAVDALNQRLKADGFDVQPPVHSHGYTFYLVAPGGFAVEVVA